MDNDNENWKCPQGRNILSFLLVVKESEIWTEGILLTFSSDRFETTVNKEVDNLADRFTVSILR